MSIDDNKKDFIDELMTAIKKQKPISDLDSGLLKLVSFITSRDTTQNIVVAFHEQATSII